MPILRLCKIVITFASIFISGLAGAATYTVNNYTDLVNALNSINTNPGTSPAASSNQVNITTTSITAIADLPVLQNGATITSTAGGTTISGGGTFNLLATFRASLSLDNISLINGLAKGGNGSKGLTTGGVPNGGAGGGGLGAGGGIYVDANQSLILTNTAQGGNGADGGNNTGSANGGAGGGASFSRTTANGVNASGSNGGGDYGGALVTPGASIATTFTSGYGGGNGGISGTSSSNPGLSTTSGGAGGGVPLVVLALGWVDLVAIAVVAVAVAVVLAAVLEVGAVAAMVVELAQHRLLVAGAAMEVAGVEHLLVKQPVVVVVVVVLAVVVVLVEVGLNKQILATVAEAVVDLVEGAQVQVLH